MLIDAALADQLQARETLLRERGFGLTAVQFGEAGQHAQPVKYSSKMEASFVQSPIGEPGSERGELGIAMLETANLHAQR